ncbi:MAG: AAA family ATPase, partial [Bacteroidota bacterium]|nr:AAA family ATPase [Bacteroidota bacterium]
MIIKEITIQNFRSYYGLNTIKFKDGLVIVIGDNGDGKTTFFEALEWLFDTTKQTNDPRLISEKKIAEIPEFGFEVLKVSMTFDHDGEKIVEKSFQFSKNAENDIVVSNVQFKGFINEGSERIPIQGGVLLDRCFEAAIRKYCLFKGEENLNVFNNPEALNYLIDTFSNISQFEPFYTGDDDNLGFLEFAEEQARKALEKDLRSDKQNSQQEAILSSNLSKLRKKQHEVRQQLKTNRDNANIYSAKLSEIESSKDVSDLLKNINERINSLSDRKAKSESLIHEDYSIRLLDDLWILCGFSNVIGEFQNKVSSFSKHKRLLEKEELKAEGKKELIKEIADGIIPLSPNVPDKISMEEMIADQFCKVCGREAKAGSEAYNFMVNKLSELTKSQMPENKKGTPKLFPNNYLKELEHKSSFLDFEIQDINNYIETITSTIEFNTARKNDVLEFQNTINIEEENKRKLLSTHDGLTEDQLQNAYVNITNWWNFKNTAEKQIVLLEKEEVDLQLEIEKLQADYNNLAKNSVASTSSLIHQTIDKIKKAFKNAKEKNTNDFLILLEEKANRYLEKLNIDGFFGIIR